MAAALVPRELFSWSLTAVAMAALEGALLGVIVKIQFGQVFSPAVVNFAVAVVAGAPAYANLSSFLFASFAIGRDKVKLLSYLMLLISACLLLMALFGTGKTGLVVFCILTVIARSAWSGIVTIRAAVWRANYQRNWRGHVTARIVRIASLLVAAASAFTGLLLDWRDDAWRFAFPIAAVAAMAAAVVYRRSRVRRHSQLLREELAQDSPAAGSPRSRGYLQILRENRDFRQYMLSMMLLGGGNLMVIPILIVLLNEYFSLARLHQVMLTSSLPLLVLVFSITYWARLLDRMHIFSYRAIHSWFMVAASAVFTIAVIGHDSLLLWLGSVLLGTAYAGGHLGWSLGHNDFSSDAESSRYMAIHVSLTGLRGLVAPLVGIGFYQFVESRSPGYGPWAMLLPLSLTTLGALRFVFLHYGHKRRN
jgi:MFS family permease